VEAVAPNLCLQQMFTVVTVRAKHGPRQPRPLLKLVLGGQKGVAACVTS